MNTVNKYVPQGPRDQESKNRPSEQQAVEQDRPNQHPEDPRLPVETPETDLGQQAAEPHDRDHQQMLSGTPGENDQKSVDGDENESKEEDQDEIEDEDVEMDKDDDEPDESGRDKDTTANKPGDAYQYPSNNPWETNPEDPAQNRKTDTMTDHEPRPAGI